MARVAGFKAVHNRHRHIFPSLASQFNLGFTGLPIKIRS
jgi:hypothetical protein